MSENEEATPAAVSADAIALSEQHLTFKRQLAGRLHEWGHDKGHCSEFDNLLMRAGLPPRRWSVDTGHISEGAVPELVGEDTVEEFEQWKAGVTKLAHEQADYHGLGDEFDELLAEVGLARRRPWVTCEVSVEGTFKIPTHIRMREGENVVDRIDHRDLLYQLRYLWNTDAVQWKATVTSEPVPED